ncbi:MAG: VWA domain-containing protein [Verrucomicrobia bacterium]|nr:VWA domain-containing protein [Verrucomicrobiota bacterium]
MTKAFWDFGISAWSLTAASLLLVAATWLFIRSLQRHRDANTRFVYLETLRFIIMLLFVFTLFRPERVSVTHKSENPRIAILSDTSDSMQTADVIQANRSALARETWLEEQFAQDAFTPLKAKYEVIPLNFGRPPAITHQEDVSEAASGTDINAALEDALRRVEGLRAAILLTDGDWNEGSSPITAATRYRMENIPLYTVAVGADRFLPDIELQSVRVPSYGLMDENVFIPFTIQSRLSRDVQTMVSLRGSDGTLIQKNIALPANGQLQDSIILKPRRRGTFNYALEIPVEREEIQGDNNQKSFQIAFRRELLKVLVIDSVPRWEYRYLRNALSRDPGVRVHCLLLHPDLGPGGGAEYLSRFPSDRDSLSQYDVIFLGDVGIGPEELSLEEAAMIRGLVEQQGSGLVFLPGQRGRQATLKGSALWDIMPVIPDLHHATGLSFHLESKLNLTSTGRDHLLTLLTSDPAANGSRWKSLPGFYWHAGVEKSRAGSDVLAVHESSRSTQGRMPLLVSRDAGNGKTLFMGTDSAWRWRRGVEDTYHYRFWGQVVRWMAHQRHLAYQEGIRFFYTPENPRRGNEIFLHATVLDGSGFPIKSGDVPATLQHESEARKTTLSMRPETGDWGVFTGAFTPPRGGTYKVTIACKSAQRAVTTDIVVASQQHEQLGRPAKVGLLQEMASITEGKFAGTDELAGLVNQILLLPESTPHEHRLRLWAHPLWCAFLISLLCIQWLGRKLLGMI